jgi:branched-chain amino acid transport system ATP-binding protein
MGKTTTIRSIMGFTPPTRGVISFKGIDITSKHSYQRARLGIALCPQGRRIFPSLTVEENLTMAARNNGRSKNATFSLTEVYLRYPVLKERAKLKGTLLSGGEQQMLAIGRALMTNPDLFMLDEPSEGLAPMIVRDIGKIIMELKETGLSILLVEQNLNMALSVVDYTYIISNGQNVYSGSPSELAEDERTKELYLGVAR